MFTSADLDADTLMWTQSHVLGFVASDKTSSCLLPPYNELLPASQQSHSFTKLGLSQESLTKPFGSSVYKCILNFWKHWLL